LPRSVERALTSPSFVRSARSVWPPRGVASASVGIQRFVRSSTSIAMHAPRKR